MECFEDGGGSGIASAEFAGEAEGVGDSEAGKMRREVDEIKEVEEGMAEGNRKLKRDPSTAPRATASRWKSRTRGSGRDDIHGS